MKKLVTLLLLIICCGVAQASSKKEDVVFNYELKSAGIGQAGYYIVEASVYVKSKSNVNMDEIKKAAVHGVIFKGVAGDPALNYAPQRPILSPTAEAQHADFFASFFSNKQYLSYATEVSPKIQTLKVGKQYKITATVQVAKDQLRKDLIQAGIAKKMGL